MGRIVSQVFRGRDAATVTTMYHVACDMLEGCCPRAAAILEEAEPDALAYLDFPPSHWKRLRADNVQERTDREIKRRSRVVQVFPSTARRCGSRARSCAGRTRCGRSRGTSRGARMNELYDDGRTRGTDGPVDWARLEAEARKMLESGLELADRIEAA
ncbi:transposase [Collinsella sp. SGI.184]|uniref:transposase n=1 Tax=Collinsella sp. SGI.184 TaxID=3420556 RepID=UPI003D0172A3